ncbi:MAG: amidohydrolase, partial [Sporomusa sp.]
MSVSLLADTVLLNGIVYTADAHDAICQAVAIKQDKIIFVGSNEQVTGYIGQATKKIDLQGKMVVPGFIDSHIHPPGIALSELYEVQLFGIKT